jgi:hypothetical protein
MVKNKQTEQIEGFCCFVFFFAQALFAKDFCGAKWIERPKKSFSLSFQHCDEKDDTDIKNKRNGLDQRLFVNVIAIWYSVEDIGIILFNLFSKSYNLLL